MRTKHTSHLPELCQIGLNTRSRIVRPIVRDIQLGLGVTDDIQVPMHTTKSSRQSSLQKSLLPSPKKKSTGRQQPNPSNKQSTTVQSKQKMYFRYFRDRLLFIDGYERAGRGRINVGDEAFADTIRRISFDLVCSEMG